MVCLATRFCSHKRDVRPSSSIKSNGLSVTSKSSLRFDYSSAASLPADFLAGSREIRVLHLGQGTVEARPRGIFSSGIRNLPEQLLHVMSIATFKIVRMLNGFDFFRALCYRHDRFQVCQYQWWFPPARFLRNQYRGLRCLAGKRTPWQFPG